MEEQKLINRIENCLKQIESEKKSIRIAARNLEWWRKELQAARNILNGNEQMEILI